MLRGIAEDGPAEWVIATSDPVAGLSARGAVNTIPAIAMRSAPSHRVDGLMSRAPPFNWLRAAGALKSHCLAFDHARLRLVPWAGRFSGPYHLSRRPILGVAGLEPQTDCGRPVWRPSGSEKGHHRLAIRWRSSARWRSTFTSTSAGSRTAILGLGHGSSTRGRPHPSQCRTGPPRGSGFPYGSIRDRARIGIRPKIWSALAPSENGLTREQLQLIVRFTTRWDLNPRKTPDGKVTVVQPPQLLVR